VAIRLRSCASEDDKSAISDFLTRHYLPGNRDGNWLQPIWEYAYTHPRFDESALGRIGIWEDGGEVVGVATYESRLGEAFFNTHPRYSLSPSHQYLYSSSHRRSCEGFPGRVGMISEEPP